VPNPRNGTSLRGYPVLKFLNLNSDVHIMRMTSKLMFDI
jgi:hypothetical protein